jgi:hypothetical protein
MKQEVIDSGEPCSKLGYSEEQSSTYTQTSKKTKCITGCSNLNERIEVLTVTRAARETPVILHEICLEESTGQVTSTEYEVSCFLECNIM